MTVVFVPKVTRIYFCVCGVYLRRPFRGSRLRNRCCESSFRRGAFWDGIRFEIAWKDECVLGWIRIVFGMLD